MNRSPLISVVLSAYNAENYIADSIQSILDQTFSDFEFIIINDGSSDKTQEVIDRFTDSRIISINHSENKNQAVRANEGIDMAKGKYIARIDADDTAMVDRFEKQIAFLERNKEIEILGSQIEVIDAYNNKVSNYKLLPYDSAELNLYRIFFCPFVHSSVMFKRQITNDIKYRENFIRAQDYMFFTEVLNKYKGANLKTIHCRYRVHDKNSHKSDPKSLFNFIQEIFRENLKFLGIKEDLESLISNCLLISESNSKTISRNDLKKLDLWTAELKNILGRNTKLSLVNIKSIIGRIWKECYWKIEKDGRMLYLSYLLKHGGLKHFSIREMSYFIRKNKPAK